MARLELGQVSKIEEAGAEPVAAPDLKRRFQVVKTSKAPVIDGRLDDAAWGNAEALGGFCVAQDWNDTSVPKLAADRTEAMLLYDEKGIYVGVRAFQDPATIYTTIKANGWLRPDLDWQTGSEPWANTGCDEIEVVIDPELTRTSHYIFQVNPDNARRAQYMPPARPSDGLYKRIDPVPTNDERWQSATSRDEKGWYAEVFIPYECIGFQEMKPAAPNAIWFDMVQDWTVMGININRISHQRREPSSWSVSRGEAFFRDAENFADAYFRQMPCSLSNVKVGDVFRGDCSVTATARSRSGKAEDVIVKMRLAAEGKETDSGEMRLSVAPGATADARLEFHPAGPGMQTVEVTLVNAADGWLLDRARYAFEVLPALEVALPKETVFDDDRDFYADVTVNAPEGVRDLAYRLLGEGGAIVSGSAGRLERGKYRVPFDASGLAPGRYEFEAYASAGDTHAGGGFVKRFTVAASPYRMTLRGAAGEGAAAGAPEAFKVLGTDMPKRARRRGGEAPEAVEEAPAPTAVPVDMGGKAFVLFATTATEDFAGNAAPRKGQLAQPIRAFASGGEYEAVAFAVAAGRDVEGLTLSASEPRSKSGGVIAADQMDLRAERPDGLLVKQETLGKLAAGMSRRYFLTVYVAPGTPAGLYEGTLSAAINGTTMETRGYSLLVLPTKLAEPPIWYSIYGRLYGSADPERDRITAVDLKAHGVDNLTCIKPFGGSVGADVQQRIWDLYLPSGEGYIPESPAKWDLALDEGFFTFLKESGARGPIVIDVNYLIRYTPCTEENAAGFEKAIRQIEAKRREHGLPEFVYHLVDEPNNHYTYDDGRYGRRYGIERVAFFGKALHNVGVRCYETLNSGSRGYEIALKAADAIDIYCPNQIHDASLVKLWSGGRRETWLYNYAGDGALKGRRSTYGLYPLAIGATGVTQWVHYSYTFWNNEERKYVNTTQWEALREGVDDARYVRTLQEAIARARAAGDARAATAAEAEKDLSAILSAYPVVTSEKVEFEKRFDADQWNKWRWRMAAWVLRLEGKI